MEFNFFKSDRTHIFNGKLSGVVDPSYGILIKKLENDYNFSTGWKLKVRVLSEFAKEYMMPKEFWNNLFTNYNCFTANKKRYQTLSMAPYCYAFKTIYRTDDKVEKVFRKLRFIFIHISYQISKFKDMNTPLSFVKNVDVLVENLSFPHWQLDEIWSIYEKNICSPPSKAMIEVYHKMKALHLKLESLENAEDEVWLETLLEADDHDSEFVEQSIEYRIGEDLSNLKLWKLYIQYLKRRQNTFKLLQTYSRYCRVVLDDKTALKEYQKEVKEYGRPWEVAWRKPLFFEKYTEDAEKAWTSEPPPIPKNETPKKKLSIFFQTNGMLPRQDFSFKQTSLHYIMQKSSSALKQKLQKTCKFFYSKYSLNVCYKFAINDEANDEICESSIQFSSPEKMTLKNLCISGVLKVALNSAPNALSQIIPKITQCDARYLWIYKQNLTFNELKLLIGHGKVVELNLEKCVTIYEKNGDLVPLEDILKLIPKIETFQIHFAAFTPFTAQTLLDFPFESKFIRIDLQYITKDLDPYVFVEFLNKNCLSHCEFNFFTKESENYDEFFSIAQEELRKHWGYKGPRFNCNTLPDDFDIVHSNYRERNDF